MHKRRDNQARQAPIQGMGGPGAARSMAARSAGGAAPWGRALPDPTATELPISFLILSEDPTLPHALWNALVQTLGEAETQRRYELPRWRTDSGKKLLHVLQRGTLRTDVVLVDVRAHAGLAELGAQRYQGFTRVPAQFEPEGELLRPPVVALVPNHPELVSLDEDEGWVFQPQWQRYFLDWGYAGALVFPEDATLLHRVLQEVLEQPVTPRVTLPPPPVVERQPPLDPHPWHRSAEQAAVPPAWGTQASLQRQAAPTAGTERLVHPEALANPPAGGHLAPVTGLVDLAPAVEAPNFKGVLAVWSPFDYAGRTTAALELAVGLQLAGYPTLLGEFRRPFGFLAQKLTLDDQSFACSLLALAGAVNDQFKQGDPFVLPREAVQHWLLRGLPLYDLRRQTDGPRLEFFHTGLTARQEGYYDLEVLQDPKQAMLRQLIEMLKEWPTFTILVAGSNGLDPLHFAALAQCDRLLICLPLDTSLFGVAVASTQMLQRHIAKQANNIDLVFTRWNRVLQQDALPEVARACYDTGELAERHLRKFLQALKVEREVEGLLKACGLSTIAGFLPDERPLVWQLARKPPLTPALLHEDLAQDPYVLSIRRQLLPNYITLPAASSSPAQDKPRWGLFR